MSPVVWPVYRAEFAATAGKTVIWAPLLLFLGFAICLRYWLRWVHQCTAAGRVLGLWQPQYWWKDWAIAFCLGAVGVTLLYSLQLLAGWGLWNSPTGWSSQIWAEGLLVGVGVGFVEELIFRGWLLYELEQDFRPEVALWLNALIFAIAHFLRPLSEILATWPQFAGLLLLGAALVWARRIPHNVDRQTTLGAASGLHGGLVFAYYQVDVNDLVTPSSSAPEWITGIGGNPLAGLLGLVFLGGICGMTYIASHRKQKCV
ncbi:MAG: CPBP family intramembrane glutamic endopeptidase [Leptolyngbyaceae cyanobacterium]